jgi:hypothetical protein
MGQEDARRGCVSWLVEPFDGNRIHRLVQSTHPLGAEALAKTHHLSLAALGEKMSLKSSQMTHPYHATWSLSFFARTTSDSSMILSDLRIIARAMAAAKEASRSS